MTPDLTIVGAGLSGLTAAIEAAGGGRRVTVAEAHSRPGGRARSLPAPFLANAGPRHLRGRPALPTEVATDNSFRAWLLRHVDARTAEAIIGVTFVFTLDQDPGRLRRPSSTSAFAGRSPAAPRYVIGGWSTLVHLLVERAAGLGGGHAPGPGCPPCPRARRSWPPTLPRHAGSPATDR